MSLGPVPFNFSRIKPCAIRRSRSSTEVSLSESWEMHLHNLYEPSVVTGYKCVKKIRADSIESALAWLR